VKLGADQHLFQGHRHLDLAGKVRILERVRVADALMRHELDIFSAEGVALARREIAKRHSEFAADFPFHGMNGGGKAVGRQPLGHGVRFEKRAVEFLGRRGEHAVQANRAGHFGLREF
jgi:hypothetical protein